MNTFKKEKSKTYKYYDNHIWDYGRNVADRQNASHLM